MGMRQSIDVPLYSPRFAVVLLKGVTASNGQEFQPGQTAGFSAESAKYLVASGAARWPSPPLVSPPATPPTQPRPAPVTSDIKTQAVKQEVIKPDPTPRQKRY